MTSYRRGLPVFLVAAAVSVSGVAIPSALADDDDNEIPFTVAKVLIQLNDTDGDLGFHARIDGEPWRRIKIKDPRGRSLLNIKTRGRLQRQGLTEFAFESAEPKFDELPPEVFFRRFPEGEYEIEGRTLDGREMESEVAFSHVIPAAPNLLTPAPLDCDDPSVVPNGPVTISWDPVVASHPDLGAFDPAIEVARYIVTVEREEPAPVLRYDVELPPEETEFEVPAAFVALGTQFKFQVLVAEARGNETSAEGCFDVAGQLANAN